MRAIYLLGFLAMLAPAAAEPLPDGGMDVQMPGFTVHSPGKPWLMRGAVAETNKDGSLFGARPPGFAIFFRAFPQAGDDSSVYVTVSGTVIPSAARDVRGAVAEIKKQEDASIAAPSTRNRNIRGATSEVTVNGNLCVRTEMTSEDVGVPGHQGEPFPMAIHGLMCPHPEFPSFVVSIEYSTRLAPGKKLFVPEADGFAVQNSLKFTSLGYRVSQIPIGEMAQIMTEAEGSVWVAYGKDAGRVARIDPATNAVTANIPVGRLPIGIVGDASGVWVANRDDNTVMRIDPKTNSVVTTIKVSGGPQLLASGAGAIWVVSKSGSVSRIDPATNEATTIANVGGESGGIAVVNGFVYVNEYRDDRIARIDPATNKIVGRIPGARFIAYLLADGQYLWGSVQEARPATPYCFLCAPEEVTSVRLRKHTAMLKIDTAAPDAVPDEFTYSVGNMPRGFAMWRGKLWVANWTGASLSVLDPRSGGGMFFPIGIEPVSVLAAQGALWVTLSGPTHAVMRLDPE